MGDVVKVEVTERVVTIAFDRPEKRNAFNAEMSRQTRQAILDHEDTKLPIVFKSSTPGMFISGADVAALKERTVDETLRRSNSRLFQAIEEHPWPTIAAVDGYALGGGCELALACDFRISTRGAKWGFPEVTLGIIPSAGGLTRLPKLVGHGIAAELLMTGRRIDAEEALRAGLVNRLVDDDDLEGGVEAFLKDLGRGSIEAARLIKEAMRVTGDRNRLIDAASQALCISSDEAQARMTALVERQKS